MGETVTDLVGSSTCVIIYGNAMRAGCQRTLLMVGIKFLDLDAKSLALFWSSLSYNKHAQKTMMNESVVIEDIHQDEIQLIISNIH